MFVDHSLTIGRADGQIPRTVQEVLTGVGEEK